MIQKAVADILSALKIVAAVSVAAAKRVDTAAYKHPAAAAEDGEVVNEVAAISNLPAVVAEELYFAAEAVEGAPDPVKSQG